VFGVPKRLDTIRETIERFLEDGSVTAYSLSDSVSERQRTAEAKVARLSEELGRAVAESHSNDAAIRG